MTDTQAPKPSSAPFSVTFRHLWRRLRGGQLTPMRAAASVGLGVFVGCLPLYGVQFWICLAIAVPLRLDYPLALLSTLIANPLTMPFLLLVEVEIGAFIASGHWVPFSFASVRSAGVGGVIAYASIGSIVLGTLLGGAAAGLVSAWVRSRIRRLVPARTASSSQPVPSVRPG